MNTNVLNLWMKATASFVCRRGDCENCYNVYGIRTCPDNNTDVTDLRAMEFIRDMTDLLRSKDEEMPFQLDISDEDFLKLLEEATTIDKQGLEPCPMPEI